MGIELGSIGPAISSTAGAVGRAGIGIAEAAAPAFGSAPALAGLGRFGTEISSPALPLNEGPAGNLGLENTMKLSPLPIGQQVEIRFVGNPLEGLVPVEPSSPDKGGGYHPNWRLDQAEILASNPALSQEVQPESANGPVEATSAGAQVQPGFLIAEIAAPVVKPAVLPSAEPRVVPIAEQQLQPARRLNFKASTVLEPKDQTKVALSFSVGTQPNRENKVFSQLVPATQAEPVLEQEEKVITETVDKEKPREIVVEDIEEQRLVGVVDEEVLEGRIAEFNEAIDKVADSTRETVGETEEIDGKKVAEALGPETEDKRSGIVKKHGPDGSRVETIEEIKARKFHTANEAKKHAIATIYSKEPVKRARIGRQVRPEAVARVLKYFFVKHQQEKAAVRIIQRRILQTATKEEPAKVFSAAPSFNSQTEPESPPESKLEHYPKLAEVFKQAA